MKKLTIIALSSALLSPLAAQAGWQGNWLLGVSGAYNWYDGEFGVTVNNAVPLTFAYENDFDSSGSSWGILGGYQAKCNSWLLGTELSVEWENETLTQNYNHAIPGGGVPGSAINVSANYERDATIGLTGRLGYEVTCWLTPFIRAGVEASRDKMNVTMGNDNSSLSYYAEASSRSYRFVGGVGADIPLFSNLMVRAEYNYRSRNNTLNTMSYWLDTTGAPVNPLSTTDYHNYTNTGKVSVIYNFC